MGEPSEHDKWQLSKILDKDGRLVGTLILDIECLPNPQMGTRLYITFPYEGRPLPFRSEIDEFQKIDDQIQKICEKLKARNVAIWTNNGVRDWIVYAEDAVTFEKLASALFRGYGAKIEVQADPMWRQYAELLEMADRPKPI